jgi:hypothetical protein
LSTCLFHRIDMLTNHTCLFPVQPEKSAVLIAGWGDGENQGKRKIGREMKSLGQRKESEGEGEGEGQGQGQGQAEGEGGRQGEGEGEGERQGKRFERPLLGSTCAHL